MHKLSNLAKIVLILLLVCIRCTNKKEMELQIINSQVLEDIGAASGMEIIGDTIYIISDNSPWLFTLNRAYKVTNKIQITALEKLVGGTIPKVHKPDFEAMALVKGNQSHELFLFGSGSKSPERDTLVRARVNVDQANDVQILSLEKVYSGLRKTAHMEKNALNIEAATVVEEDLYLFNRGENMIIRYNLENFIGFVTGKSLKLQPEIFHIDLPEIDEITSGFSGASMISDDSIVFTASVENTANWIDDGPVLGSFAGIIHLKELKENYQPRCILIQENQQPLKIKVESVAVLDKTTSNQLKLLFVTDSDGGESEIIEAVLNLDTPRNQLKQ